ncbi:MAG: hypothetical protein H7Y60_03155 [Rhodospirillaceae bacterium]|nr:hypothetical protein [Rhodospirillales bacterium]
MIPKSRQFGKGGAVPVKVAAGAVMGTAVPFNACKKLCVAPSSLTDGVALAPWASKRPTAEIVIPEPSFMAGRSAEIAGTERFSP